MKSLLQQSTSSFYSMGYAWPASTVIVLFHQTYSTIKTESNSVLKLAHVDAILLWYSGLSFDLRLVNKINACREKTGLTTENRIDNL